MSKWIAFVDQGSLAVGFLESLLSAALGVVVQPFGSGSVELEVLEAKTVFSHKPKCIVFLNIPAGVDEEWERVARKWRDTFPDTPMLVVTGDGDQSYPFIDEIGATRMEVGRKHRFSDLCKCAQEAMGVPVAS